MPLDANPDPTLAGCRPYCEDERVRTVHELGKIDETRAKPQDPEIANILKLVASIFQVSAVCG